MYKRQVYLEPKEFKSTWLGNKAVYRTRMAIADGGELLVLAPGVERFGEDDAVDALIRKYGYCGRLKVLELFRENQDLRDNMGAAAHLIHGSSDGRFTVTYAVKNLSLIHIYSKVDKYNVVDATPFGRDIVAELAEACYKHGLKFGLYYSQDLDWHEEHGGGYRSNHIPCAGTAWSNNWDFPGEADKDYSICFSNKILPQIEEILTNYGELCLIWFDVPMTLKEEESRKIFETVKRYQPNCLINSRLGNGARCV